MKIFISYSRAEREIADRLVADLEARSFDVLIDRQDLPYGEQWQDQLAALIRSSDTIVWLASATSVNSRWVKWELGEVQRINKRLIPIRVSPLTPEDLPEALGRIHILPAEGIYDPARHFDDLVTALETDRAWMETHTRLADRATEWIARNRSNDRLLRGRALGDAELWRDSRPERAPAPSTDTLDLLLQSRRGATRGLRRLIGIVAVGFVLMAGLAGYAVLQADVAQKQTVEAEAQRGLAQGNAYRNLASLATASQIADQPRDAIRLALAAWPRSSSSAVPRLETTLLTMSRVLSGDRLPEAETASGVSLREDDTRQAGSTFAAWVDDTALVWRTGLDLLRIKRPAFVAGLALSHDGTRLAIADKSEVVVWNLGPANRQIVAVLQADSIGTALSLDGTQLATWSNERFTLWDIGDGTAVAVTSAETGRNATASFSPDGKFVAIAAGNDLRLVKASRETEPASHALLPSEITGVAFSDDAARLVVWSADRRLRQFSTAGLAPAGPDILYSVLPVDSPPAEEPVGMKISIFNSDIRGATYIGNTGRLVAWSADGTLRMWNATTGNLTGTVMQHDHIVSGATLSGDRSKILSWSDDGTLKLWDSGTGLQLSRTMRNDARVRGARIIEDQGRIISWSSDGTVRLWNLADGDQIGGSLQLGASPVGVSLDRSGNALTAIAETGVASQWEVSLGAQISPTMQHKGAVDYAFASSTGDRIFAWGGDTQFSPTGDKRLRIWSAADGHLMGQTDEHLGMRMWAMLSPDEQTVLTMTSNAIYLWDAHDAHLIAGPYGLQEVVDAADFWPQQQQIITGSDEGIRYWRDTDLAPVGDTLDLGSPVQKMELLDDNSRLLVQTEDGALHLIDTASRRALLPPMPGSAGPTGFTVSKNGKRVASYGDTGIQLWDLGTGKPIGPETAGESIYNVVFALDDSRVVIREDSSLHVLDAATGGQIGDDLPLEQMTAIVLGPDDRSLLIAPDNSTLQIWDLASNQASPALFWTTDANAAEFSADGTRLLTRHGRSDSMRLWDVASGMQIGPLMAHGSYLPGWRDADGVRHTYMGDFIGLRGATFMPGGKRALSWSKDGTLKLWNIDYPPGNLIEIACARLGNTDLGDLERRYRINITDPICTPEQRAMQIDWSHMEMLGPAEEPAS